MKLSLDVQSVDVLRTFSKTIPKVMDNIRESTKKLVTVYNQVSDGVGPHDKDFLDMLCSIERVQKIGEESILILAKSLEESASKIEKYLTPLEKELVGQRSEMSMYAEVLQMKTVNMGNSFAQSGESKLDDEDNEEAPKAERVIEKVPDYDGRTKMEDDKNTFSRELQESVVESHKIQYSESENSKEEEIEKEELER